MLCLCAAPNTGRPMFYDALATAIENAGRDQLDECARQSLARPWWRQPYRRSSRPALWPDPCQAGSRAGAQSGGFHANAGARVYYIQRSPEQRSPDRRASLLRRRQHAATGPLPPNLAANFTTGELAALKIVADEFLAHGACDISRNEIGARAGVSQSVVKRALRLASAAYDDIGTASAAIGRKHLTNIIRISGPNGSFGSTRATAKPIAIKACDRAKPDFKRFRGSDMDPPRAQHFKKADSDRVDKIVEKRNRPALVAPA